MSEQDPATPEPATAERPPAVQPVSEKFRELAELEAEIQQQLRSNQRFLEKFLDEDFVDDETEGNSGEQDCDEEEL